MIRLIEKYNITADTIWNWDEKGFLIGVASAVQRIMTLEALKSGRITHASHDGSREFISLLACICANGTALPPALIYGGEAFQNTWLEDVNANDEAFFATSSKGWSNDDLGYKWLVQVFDRCTKHLKHRRRLLIVDGHSSHVNMKFINRCDELRILLAVLPSHSTHRLQPLDVGLFSPLATHYTNGLNEMNMNSLGIVRMTKRAFWSLFLPAWRHAFTEKNITSAFIHTGIFPFDPTIILDTITKQATSATKKSIKSVPATPMSGRAVRRVHRAYTNNPTSPFLAKIMKANERMAAELSIKQHIIQGLSGALINEKRRRNRGIRLNISGEREGGPQFFSPNKVQAARDILASKEDEKMKKKEDLAVKRAQTALNKSLIEKAKQERSLAAAEKRRMREEAEQARAAEKQAQNELNSIIIVPQQPIIGPHLPSTSTKQAMNKGRHAPEGDEEVWVDEEVEEVIPVTSRGRPVRMPKKFGS